MVLPILTIIASWIFKMPLEWSITLTVFAALHLLAEVIGLASAASNDH